MNINFGSFARFWSGQGRRGCPLVRAGRENNRPRSGLVALAAGAGPTPAPTVTPAAMPLPVRVGAGPSPRPRSRWIPQSTETPLAPLDPPLPATAPRRAPRSAPGVPSGADSHRRARHRRACAPTSSRRAKHSKSAQVKRHVSPSGEMRERWAREHPRLRRRLPPVPSGTAGGSLRGGSGRTRHGARGGRGSARRGRHGPYGSARDAGRSAPIPAIRPEVVLIFVIFLP